jgi:hypothetical protein
MRDPDPGATRLVAQRLATAGLQGPAFDLDAIVADYIDRLEMDRSLDPLIGPGEPGADGERH